MCFKKKKTRFQFGQEAAVMMILRMGLTATRQGFEQGSSDPLDEYDKGFQDKLLEIERAKA